MMIMKGLPFFYFVHYYQWENDIVIFLELIKENQQMFGAHRLSINEIYHYLNNRDFSLSSDKILKDPQAHPEIIWGIFVYLCYPLKDQKYQQIQPSLAYLLDNDVYKGSLKKMSQYICVSTVLKKLGFSQEYPFKQIFKPDREHLIEKLSVLIQAHRFHQNISKQFDHSRLEIKSLSDNIKKERARQEQFIQQIHHKKLQIQAEKQQREQRKSTISSLTSQLNYKKKQFMDLLNIEADLRNEGVQKKRILQNIKDQGINLNLKIKELQRNIVQNAPKLKSQRLLIIDQYEQTKAKAQNSIKIEQLKMKVIKDNLKEVFNIKNISQSKLIQKKSNQIKELIENIELQKQQKITKKKNIEMEIIDRKQLRQAIDELQRQTNKNLRNLKENQMANKQYKGKIQALKGELRVLNERFAKIEEKQKTSKEVRKQLNNKVKFRLNRLDKRRQQLNYRKKTMEEQFNQIFESAFSGFENY